MSPVYEIMYGWDKFITASAQDAVLFARHLGAIGIYDPDDEDGEILLALDADIVEKSRGRLVAKLDDGDTLYIECVRLIQEGEAFELAVMHAVAPRRMLTMEDIARAIRMPLKQIRRVVWNLAERGELEPKNVASVQMWQRVSP